MKLQVVPVPRHRTSALTQVKEGISYALSNRVIRVLIANMTVVSLFGLSMVTLLPAWSVDVLGGDVKTNGLLLSARGAGALIGALMVASLVRMRIQGKIWTAGSFVMPVALFIFALARWIPLSVAFIVVVGWSFMIQANTSNALVQTQVPDDLRGRVMSIYTLTLFGGMPIGALLAGTLATYLGEPITLLLNSGVLIAFAGLVYQYVPRMRRLA